MGASFGCHVFPALYERRHYKLLCPSGSLGRDWFQRPIFAARSYPIEVREARSLGSQGTPISLLGSNCPPIAWQTQRAGERRANTLMAKSLSSDPVDVLIVGAGAAG